jgi:hypothetical protein
MPSLEPFISNTNIEEDTISISNEAKELLKDDKGLILDDEDLFDVAEMLKQLRESSKTSPDDPLIVRLKCMVIATRIRNGDNVPNKDTRFLLENEPEMYLRAILFRQKNNNPKKYKSILEDEKNDSVEESSSGVSSVSKNVEVSISDNNIEVSVDVE